jgi:hypothetical protein
MNSLFAQLFQSLQTHIIAAVPEIKSISPDLGQTDNYKDMPTQWPVLFIDFNNINCTELMENVQRVSGELQCKLACNIFVPDGSTFIDTATAISYYEVEHKLHQALQGWSNNNIVPLSRTKINTEVRTDAFRVRVLIYSLDYEESVTIATSTIATPIPAIEN